MKEKEWFSLCLCGGWFLHGVCFAFCFAFCCQVLGCHLIRGTMVHCKWFGGYRTSKGRKHVPFTDIVAVEEDVRNDNVLFTDKVFKVGFIIGKGRNKFKDKIGVDGVIPKRSIILKFDDVGKIRSAQHCNGFTPFLQKGDFLSSTAVAIRVAED